MDISVTSLDLTFNIYPRFVLFYLLPKAQPWFQISATNVDYIDIKSYWLLPVSMLRILNHSPNPTKVWLTVGNLTDCQVNWNAS